MIKIDLNNALTLQKLVIDMTGGSTGVRDSALLDSALNTAFQTFKVKHYTLPLKKRQQDLALILFLITHLLMATNELDCLLC